MRNAPDQGYLGLSETRHLLIYFAGFALTVTPGKAGEALRSLYLHKFGVPWARSIVALLVERVLDLMVLATLALGYFKAIIGGLGSLSLLLTSLTLVLFILYSPVLSEYFMPRFLGKRFNSKIDLVLVEARAITSPALFGVGFSLGVLAWGAEAVGFFFLLSWVGLPLDVFEAFGIYAGSLVVGALSFLPGGIGGAEAAMTALLKLQGASISMALMLTLVCRLVTLWFSVLLGLIAVGFLEKNAIGKD